MARTTDLEKLSVAHDIPMLRIADLIDYRKHERQIRRKSETVLPTRDSGSWRFMVYSDDLETTPVVAMVKGEVGPDQPVLTRLHSQCLTGDVFGSERCDCGEQLEAAMAKIEAEGRGVIVYMFDEGRGIGLLNKIRAYALQDQGKDTVEANHALGFAADMRDFKTGAHILFDLGARKIRLITNNPEKVKALEDYGLTVSERVAIDIAPREANRRYLDTKRSKFGHLLSMAGKSVEPESGKK
jgi:3,4-dihydroxy 2-butanone 4-phosphate synthase/GTP cyclohydrolase II